MIIATSSSHQSPTCTSSDQYALHQNHTHNWL